MIFSEGSYFPGQPLFAEPLQLPDGYEVETSAERIQGEIVIESTTDDPNGVWRATASWEPNAGYAMPDDERARLFGQCDLLAPSPALLAGLSA
jgi:hypothetical protein